MAANVHVPSGKTILLSAGPRAGKTALMLRWREESPLPVQFVALTPEDCDPPFFLHRLLQPWPTLKARYDELAGESLSSSWGGLLGMALGETHPDFHLLVDGFDLIEGSPLEPGLLALFRHFPGTGTLAVASRHQLPAIDRVIDASWDADHPNWHERPAFADLLRLPSPLLSRALALHLVGESTLGPEGWELVRRNVAMRAGSVLRLRPAWREAAELAWSHPLPDAIWDDLEQGLREHLLRHERTARELELPAILERLPSEVRRSRPFLRQVEGDLLTEAERHQEARACYEQAIALSLGCPRARMDLDIRLANLEVRAHDFPRVADLLHRLRHSGVDPSFLQRAQILNLQGVLAYANEQVEQARKSWQGVLSIPADGERAIHRQHFLALVRLHLSSVNLSQALDASSYAEQAIALATTQGFQRDLMEAYVARISCLLLDESTPPPLWHFLEIPNEAFTYASPLALLLYLQSLGKRALMLLEFDLALRFYRQLKQSALIHHRFAEIQLANVSMLDAFGYLECFDEGRSVYAELQQAPSFRGQEHHIRLLWSKVLVSAERHQEAEAALSEESESLPECYRAQAEFARLWIRHRGGDKRALPEIRTLMESPEGTTLWNSEALLLQRIGLRSVPPKYRIHAFGSLTLYRDEQSLARWPRKKALSMLALLVLHPEGLKSSQLADALFTDTDQVDASDSLHTVAYGLRQVLKAADAEDLLESSRGFYRLQRGKVAFCDLHEFNAFYRKAQDLEAEDMPAAAATFYALALALAKGPLFENLPDEFEEARSDYRERVRNAQAFLRAHHTL